MKTFVPKLSKSFTPLVLIIFAGTGYAQTTHDVSVSDYSFSPASIEIQVGDAVKWTNNQGSHNVNGTIQTNPANPLSFGNNVGEDWTYTFTFTQAGTYKYQCDPHVAMGMVGEVIVTGGGGNVTNADVTIEFSSMNPHLNQQLWLSLVNQETNEIIQRINETITTTDFTVEFPEVETGKPYRIDFYADHNGNGSYDAPPTDHAWRIEIESLKGDTVVPFVHNTNFTDILDTQTGVKDMVFSHLILYPNPAGAFVRISGRDLPPGSLSIQVLNMSGQLVRSETRENNGNMTINLQGLTSGAYYLLVKGKNFAARAKLIKTY